MRVLVLGLIWLMAGLPLGVAAQDALRVERMQAAFATWLARQGAAGAMAIHFKGVPVATYEGGAAADDWLEMASLGKAITAVCVAEMVCAGRLSYDARLPALIGQGPDVTVGNLLAQDSGITTDVTQTGMLQWLDTPEDRAQDVADLMQGPKDPVGRYSYNNVNYSLLSLVIEAVSDASVHDTCSELALRPAGATARPSPRAGGFLAWGGWQMTVEDYARFHGHWFNADSPLGADPMAHPNAQVTDAVSYGLGTFFRRARAGHNYWHFGALCFPGRLNVGSYAVTWQSEWTVVAAYDACVDFEAMLSLDLALGDAAYGVLQ